MGGFLRHFFWPIKLCLCSQVKRGPADSLQHLVCRRRGLSIYCWPRTPLETGLSLSVLDWGRAVLGEQEVDGAAVCWLPQAIWATRRGAGSVLRGSSKP